MIISLHIELAAAALDRGEEYAFRDWMLVPAAGDGRGHCRVADFRAFLRGHGYRRSAVAEILERLAKSGLVATHRAKRGHDVLVPLAVGRMIDRYGVRQCRWRVRVELAELKGNGLRRCLAAYIRAGLGETPIARATLLEMTGVSKSTQIRGEKGLGGLVRPTFIRADPSTFENLPCPAEGREKHRTYRRAESVYIQTANSVSFPTISRRKRVTYGTDRHCSDNRAQQPTFTRRYFTDIKCAAKKKVWRFHDGCCAVELPVVIREEPVRLGGVMVDVYGLV